RQRLIFEFNDTVAEYPQACLHELFEEQVEKQPDALAVVFEETSLTYAELNARANQLAHHLRTLGIGPESVVGISVEKSPEMVVGLLGILKAGAAYAPLDPAYPKERLEFMLQDAQVPVLLTQERLLPDLPVCDAQVICLDRDWATIAEQSQANPQRLATPDHPSYVIYTSGTTGLPKGIVVLHRGVVNNIHDLNTRYAVGSSDRVIAISSLSFDMCVYEVFGMLMSGGCTVIPGEAELKDPVRWAELANRHGVTIWNSAPQLLEFLVSHLERQTSVPRPPIRLVLLGGDWVPVPLPDRLKALCPQARVIVMGGATEASIHSIIFEVEETDPEWTSIPYGVPMTNQTAYILDANLQVVPVGVAGELHLGGTGLTREYLRRPQLTAEKFIENPIPDGRSTRLYKTGDLAKYRPDGNIELLGRIDLQVKIRGLRIEVGEIEMTLKQRDDIQDAVVVALADKGAEKRLVAYIVPRHADALPSGVELRAYLAARLPNYMVPALFVHLEKLPLSPNGKVDRRSLPAPTANDILHDAAYTAPSNALEEMLVDIYADVLGVELVGIHDDFFALGGHSLLATQVLSRIREAFGSELTLRNLFDAPTVGALAPLVEMNREQGSRSETQLDTILPIPLEQRSQMPMSSAQQRLWFLSRYLPNHAAYNVPVLLTLDGQLDVKVLEQSLNELIRRHEVLRTTYVEVNGEAMQVVTPVHHLDVATVDLAHVPSEMRRDAAIDLFVEAGSKQFDLSREMPIRAMLAQVQEAEHLLLLNIHHIAFDGWSMGVFVRELATIYTAELQNEESPLAPLPIQYGDFAAWQQESLRGEALDKQLSYWKQKLSGELPLLQLPTDRPRPAQPSFAGARQQMTLSKRLTDDLKALSRTRGVTLYMTLLAAFQTLLYRYTGQEDVIVGTPVAGRNRADLEGLIGFFVNTLVMRTDLSGSLTFAQLLHRVRDVALDSFAHQDVPFEKVVSEVLPDRDLNVSPLFQTMFVLQNNEESTWELPALSLQAEQLHVGTAMFDLTLEMEEKGDTLLANWEYSTELFDHETISRMMANFETLLVGLIEKPTRHLWELPLLTEAEQHRVLVEWNDTREEALLHQLFLPEFEAQVERTPDHIAVTYGAQQLTYRELNERANKLAHFLRKQGIRTESLVGISMERSLELIVSILGIFKSGGAYVPLDPAYPQDRLTFMMDDAQVALLLTQQHVVEALPAHEVRTICVDAEWDVIAQESASNPDFGVQADDLAYVIYTSGSTGRPKGVMITHRGLVNFSRGGQNRFLNIDDTSRVLQLASINFDASISESFNALLAGAQLVLATAEAGMLGQPLLDLLREQQVTHMMVAPSTLA
ncbi:MAG: amino acid adenylation domain-containing protein, partial [Tumebacillaceae bacterium]